MDNARQELDTVRTAIEVFAGKKIGKAMKRKKAMSAATKAKIAKAAKKRWAKIKAEKKGKA